MRSSREQLRNHGVEIDSRHLIYRSKDRILAIPYSHIRLIEFKDNKVILYTGGIEKVVIDLPHEGLSMALFQDILLQIEKLHL